MADDPDFDKKFEQYKATVYKNALEVEANVAALKDPLDREMAMMAMAVALGHLCLWEKVNPGPFLQVVMGSFAKAAHFAMENAPKKPPGDSN